MKRQVSPAVAILAIIVVIAVVVLIYYYGTRARQTVTSAEGEKSIAGRRLGKQEARKSKRGEAIPPAGEETAAPEGTQ